MKMAQPRPRPRQRLLHSTTQSPTSLELGGRQSLFFFLKSSHCIRGFIVHIDWAGSFCIYGGENACPKVRHISPFPRYLTGIDGTHVCTQIREASSFSQVFVWRLSLSAVCTQMKRWDWSLPSPPTLRHRTSGSSLILVEWEGHDRHDGMLVMKGATQPGL